jgi:hypothetical protein
MKANLNRQPTPRFGESAELIGNRWNTQNPIEARVALLTRLVPRRPCTRKLLARAAVSLMIVLAQSCVLPIARAQENQVEQLKNTVQQLVDQVKTLQARVTELEAAQPVRQADAPPVPMPQVSQAGPADSASQSTSGAPSTMGMHDMSLPGGPRLNIRGFLDFNADSGAAANPLIFPLTNPPSTVHNSFQFGEVDLFLSSKLSDSLSFVSEVIFGSDATNNWGIDIERAQLNYKPNDYFHITAGRFHTSIGYYNTTFHHGTWFQTATGRPFMFFFEDSGGILPVHMVGVSVGGLVPGTGKWNLNWIAEVGNGESSVFLSNPNVNPVQNFVSDKNHKAINVAGYIKPEWIRGLQVGGNYYYDVREPVDAPHVDNTIAGLYVVYVTPTWEFLNELQVQRDHPEGSRVTFNTPLGYTQISHKMGEFRPYFRWQEVNVPNGDPLYGSVGRFEGPSPGLRIDVTDFAALKVQYNRLYTRSAAPKNGVDGQVAFTF